MADLFPTVAAQPILDKIDPNKQQVRFGRSWQFDFGAGDFVTTPTGGIKALDPIESWVEWCKKAILTQRYRYMAYTSGFGQEYEDLIGTKLTYEAIQSEIIRMTQETLLVDPRTKAVRGFTFDKSGDQVFFECEVVNIRDEAKTIGGSVVTTR